MRLMFNFQIHPNKYTKGKNQKHFLWTIPAPPSKYYCFDTNIGWKLERDAKIDPPIQAAYFRYGGSNTLIFIVEGAKAITYFWILSLKFFNMVVPPPKVMLL